MLFVWQSPKALDIYLEVFLQDMKRLYHDGLDVFDAASNKIINVKAIILYCVADYRALPKLVRDACDCGMCFTQLTDITCFPFRIFKCNIHPLALVHTATLLVAAVLQHLTRPYTISVCAGCRLETRSAKGSLVCIRIHYLRCQHRHQRHMPKLLQRVKHPMTPRKP